MKKFLFPQSLLAGLILIFLGCQSNSENHINLKKHSKITLIGNNLCARMLEYDYFETELQTRWADSMLTVRNLCDAGDTPGFRPHPGRNTPWAFPGAEQFYEEWRNSSGSEGFFEYPDEWLTRLQTDVVIAFFGYNESFDGLDRIPIYKEELKAFINHTQNQKYNGKTSPQLVMVSPIAFEKLTSDGSLPDGVKENQNLEAYTKAMKSVCDSMKIFFIDVFHPSMQWYKNNESLTIDGFQLNDSGYRKLASYLCDQMLGKGNKNPKHFDAVFKAVEDKNFYWKNDYKVPNGVHVYGRRYNPFGPQNYPDEIKKTREMTSIRDTAIWMHAVGKSFDTQASDARTTVLKAIETNYTLTKDAQYLSGAEALKTIKTAPGFKVELFASEEDFPDLAKPVQMSFDDKGRLWVATMPSYPHYRIGDPRPNDKLLILEDTNHDGKADKQTVFADHLHLPIGFELAPEGVYLSQGEHLKLFTDTNGDDKADKIEVLLSGFDDHDTHHAISAFCADPMGALYMAEGTFLHSNVETPYGPVRGTNGGFMRFNPIKHHLERAQLPIPNPWGTAFDLWGQPFFIETSGPALQWMLPGTIKPVYGISSPSSFIRLDPAHEVRPTSGLEFVSSSHFPEEMQGDIMFNNTIGFLGTKQHQILEDSSGYTTQFRQDLIQSTDGNFRPVDLEFAPDGSLFIADWHNILIGHMQHNARDPLRDHKHGRIYRITYPSRPLVKPARIEGATITVLLDNLKLPEYRTRYRTRRALRGHDPKEVTQAVNQWTSSLDPKDKNYEHHLLEALWVSCGVNAPDTRLITSLFKSKDHRVRAAVVRVVRYYKEKIPNSNDLFKQAASDDHGRVRMEALVAASWMPEKEGRVILDVIKTKAMDSWLKRIFDAVDTNFKTRIKKEVANDDISSAPAYLSEVEKQRYIQGRKLYVKEGMCVTCHQYDGKGVHASGYPSLVQNEWVSGSDEKLIKIVLNGMIGPITVGGKNYDGKTPMVPYGGLMNDEEIAAVLTYVRNSFGNKLPVVDPTTVQKVRAATKDKKGFYTSKELNQHVQ